MRSRPTIKPLARALLQGAHALVLLLQGRVVAVTDCSPCISIRAPRPVYSCPAAMSSLTSAWRFLRAAMQGKARFVSDCASYIQSCMKPATDIFISGHEMVASIVVLPLIFKGHTFGGFYGARLRAWCIRKS